MYRIDQIRSSLLRDMSLLLLATTTLGLLVVPFTVSSVPTWLYVGGFAPFYLVIATALGLQRLGQRRAGAWVLVVGTFGFQSLGNFLNPGASEQALVSTINLILIAGFVLGRRAAGVVAGVATAAVLTYLWAASHALLPDPIFPLTMDERLPIIGLTVITTGGLMAVSMGHVTRALSSEQRSRLVAQESSQSLSLALDENALRTRLGEDLVGMGERLLQSREHLGQLSILVETLESVAGIDSVVLMTEQGRAVVERARVLGNGVAPDTDGVLRLRLEGADQPYIIELQGDPFVLRSPAAADFFHTAMGLLLTAHARVRAERQLQQAEQVQAVARLAAGISHDFNNLLVAILGGLELATHHASEGRDAGPSIQIAQRAAHRAIGLTQKMGTLGGARGDDAATASLREALTGLVGSLGASMRPGVDLRLTSDIPDVHIAADEVELGQIVENLVNNAVEATPGSGEIRLSSVVEDASVLLCVEDTGTGMTPDVLARVFEPFFTTRKGVGGHGLGLAGVKALCQSLGGSIEARSTLGVGSVFSVRIPLADAPMVATPAPAESRAALGDRGPLHGHRVLLVDDDAQVRAMVAELIRSLDAEVHVAESGEQALRVLSQLGSVTLLVSDVRMPGMDGHDLLRRIREDGHSFPTVLASGFDPVDPPDAGALGRFVRLAKPFTRAQLLEAVEVLV